MVSHRKETSFEPRWCPCSVCSGWVVDGEGDWQERLPVVGSIPGQDGPEIVWTNQCSPEVAM